MLITQHINNDEKDNQKYIPAMTKAKTEYNTLKKGIRIGTAMIRAAVGGKATKIK